MLLADQSIKKLIASGKLTIKPKAILKSASIRLHLANQFAEPGGKIFSREEYSLKPKKLIFNASDQSFLLKAGMRIGQLLIIKMDAAAEKTQPQLSQYKGKKHQGLVLPIKTSIYRYQKKRAA